MSGEIFSEFLRDKSAGEVFAWLIAPISLEQFFSEYWQKKPLLIKRKDREYYKQFLTRKAIVRQLKSDEGLRNEIDLNVARYVDGEQIMETGPKNQRADAKHALQRFKQGSSWQAVHPQRYHGPTAELLSKIEAALGCVCGSNSFITPENSRGFKPHHDEVEVFMLQLEGSKHWRLHQGDKQLPTTYKWDYPKSIVKEKPILETDLDAGDLLYFPRGTVHYATAGKHGFSHHLTVSTYQKNTWGDLLLKAMPKAIEKAMESDVKFREGLPIRWLRFAGENVDIPQTHGSDGSTGDKLKQMMHQLVDHMDFDNLADVMAAKFVASRLPPVQSGESKSESADVRPGKDLIRWTDPLAVRVVVDESPDGGLETQIYHSFQNDPSKHLDPGVAEPSPECFVLPGDDHAPALFKLFNDWPSWQQIPESASDEFVELLSGLRENGLVESRCGKKELVADCPLDTLARSGIAQKRKCSGAPQSKKKKKKKSPVSA